MYRCMKKKLLVFCLILISPLIMLGQQYSVKGRVIDASNSFALMGANVYIKGSTKGTVAKQGGDFELKRIKRGSYVLVVSYVGYYSRQIEIDVIRDLSIGDVELQIDLLGQEIIIQGSRAIEGKSAVTFNTLSEEEIKDNYTGQDVPGLLARIPGVFGSTSGLGEAEVSIRGFDAERIQILINGVPVNDPESHIVYWSNWTGLSSAASSIQVQRGVGASLIGPGALGGSINVETGNFTAEPSLKIIASTGVFHTTGIDTRPSTFFRLDDGSYGVRTTPTSGEKDDSRLLADGTGGKREYNPTNQLFSVSLSSGYLCWGSAKWNYFLSYERKAGDSYGYNTYYSGHSFYAGLQMISGKHAFTLNFHGAPQEHNQQRTTTDQDLIRRLGREYNRNAHPYQQNYYFKPVLELHWDYVNKNISWQSVVFATKGTGGGRYLRNDLFNTVTGENTFKPVSLDTDWSEFGRHARWIYENTDIELEGYNGADETYSYRGTTGTVTSGRLIIPSQFGHSWQNDSRNNHDQYGGNTTFRIKANPFEATFGGEYRYWKAQHFAESKNFRYYGTDGQPRFYNQVMNRYDYDGFVTNLSGYGRFLVDLGEVVFINVDLQYATINQRVEENPIPIFDFGSGEFINQTYTATQGPGSSFSDEDYERDYSFFTPKFGGLVRLSKNIELYASYSEAYKEPTVGDWYDREDGPGANQRTSPDAEEIVLEPEKVTDIEAGINIREKWFELSITGYLIEYEDRIESITNQDGGRLTINVGDATHKGIESSIAFKLGKLNLWASGAIAENRWADELNAEIIFSINADDVEGRYVPYSPQQMLNAGASFDIGRLTLGVTLDWWDKYYGKYDNLDEHIYNDSRDIITQTSGKLPHFESWNIAAAYKTSISGSDITFRAEVKNIFSRRDNFQRAFTGRDFNYSDNGIDTYLVTKTFVVPSPLIHGFFTVQVGIN